MLKRIAIIALSSAIGATTPTMPANTGAYNGEEETVVISIQKDDTHIGPERPEEIISIEEEEELNLF